MTDITPILQALFALVATIITTALIPYIRSKLSETQQQELLQWVRIAVAAAEQIYNQSGMGAEKKRYVLNWLRDHNITVDEEKLDAMIEAAVYQLKEGAV